MTAALAAGGAGGVIGRALGAVDKGSEVLDRASLVSDLMQNGVSKDLAFRAAAELAGVPRGAKKADDLAGDAAGRARRSAGGHVDTDAAKRRQAQNPCGGHSHLALGLTTPGAAAVSNDSPCNTGIGGGEQGAAEPVHTGVERPKKTSTLSPGPHARESVPAHRGRPTAAEQREVNDLFEKHGCHTCGTRMSGTKSGNAIADHQPPQALDEPREFLPHCIDCARRQGGEVLQEKLRNQLG